VENFVAFVEQRVCLAIEKKAMKEMTGTVIQLLIIQGVIKYYYSGFKVAKQVKTGFLSLEV